MDLTEYILEAGRILPPQALEWPPWLVTAQVPEIVRAALRTISSGYHLQADVAIHESAVVEPSAVIKGPAIISKGCIVAAGAYLRGGVFLDEEATIGPASEIKSSVVFRRSCLAHLNFVGDSLIGEDVNLEAGVVLANHWNEREHKSIRVRLNGALRDTGSTKFGALLGDHCRIGANSVTCPGTILLPGTVIGRLELVEQEKESLSGKRTS